MSVSYKEHRTNEFVRQQIDWWCGKQKPLFATGKRWNKLQWFGHFARHNDLTKTRHSRSRSDKKKRTPEEAVDGQRGTAVGRPAWAYQSYSTLRETGTNGGKHEWRRPTWHPYDRPGQDTSEFYFKSVTSWSFSNFLYNLDTSLPSHSRHFRPNSIFAREGAFHIIMIFHSEFGLCVFHISCLIYIYII